MRAWHEAFCNSVCKYVEIVCSLSTSELTQFPFGIVSDSPQLVTKLQ